MEENENLSPEFSELKRNPFSVPENYFEQFSAQMQQHIKAQPTVSKSIVIVLRPYLAAAAMIALIITISFFLRQKTTTNPSELAESQTIENLQYYGVDENQIVNYVVNEGKNEETVVESKDDEVVNYILEQGTNPELMYENAE